MLRTSDKILEKSKEHHQTIDQVLFDDTLSKIDFKISGINFKSFVKSSKEIENAIYKNPNKKNIVYKSNKSIFYDLSKFINHIDSEKFILILIERKNDVSRDKNLLFRGPISKERTIFELGAYVDEFNKITMPEGYHFHIGTMQGAGNTVVIDDVSKDNINKAFSLGLIPNVILETSEDNYQLFFNINRPDDYNLDQATCFKEYLNMLITIMLDGDILYRQHYPGNFARIPNTKNTKSKYINKNGEYFTVKMHYCNKKISMSLNMICDYIANKHKDESKSFIKKFDADSKKRAMAFHKSIFNKKDFDWRKKI